MSICASGLLLFATSCSSPEQSADVPTTQVQPVGDMHDTMTWLLDPAADTVWSSAGFVLTMDGEQDLAPTTEEGWDAVKHAGTVLAEAGNLLQFAPYAESGPAWVEYSRAMTDISLTVIDAAEQQDAERLFEVGGHLYNVCLACHQVYARPEDESTEE